MADQPPPPPPPNFETFFNNWLQQKQSLLNRLQTAIEPENIHRGEEHNVLIKQIYQHYQFYYLEKSKGARDDVFLFLSPPWYTPLERSLLWFGDFKPSAVFKLLTLSVCDLTEEQGRKLETAKSHMKRMECDVNDDMARVQESVAAPQLLRLARNFGRLVDGEVSEVDEALATLKESILVIVENADQVRGNTVSKVFEILNSDQVLRFLVAVIAFQLRVRRLGQQRDER